jgi:uncharacterized caspase-like protein
MVRHFIRLAVLLSCAFTSLATASAERRVALVIGNSLYGHHAALPNVPNDAAAMAAMLKGAGFDSVVVQANLSIAGLRVALRDFGGEVATADVAVLFYAGHGIEVGGTNYLIPVDARLATDYDVEDETVALDRVLQAMAPAKRLRLVVLDACRDNPFVKTMKRTVAGRDVGRGLTRFEPTVGNTLIAFATRPNAIALDGKGSNSPFTTALLKHLATPGLDLRLALGDVRDDVLASTGGKQEPYLTGSLGGGTFAIVGGTPKPPVAPPVASQSGEAAAQAWAAAKDSTSIAVLEAFRRQYGAANAFYDRLAEARIEELKKQELAMLKVDQKPQAAASAEKPFAGSWQVRFGCGIADQETLTITQHSPTSATGKWTFSDGDTSNLGDAAIGDNRISFTWKQRVTGTNDDGIRDYALTGRLTSPSTMSGTMRLWSGNCNFTARKK